MGAYNDDKCDLCGKEYAVYVKYMIDGRCLGDICEQCRRKELTKAGKPVSTGGYGRPSNGG